MNLTGVSKRLSWLLRHGANESGLEMDAAGFASIADVMRLARVSGDDLREVVEGNDKERFEVRGKRIRAAQGHSLEGTPVTREGLEASWESFEGDDLLWHGTNLPAARSIATSGIHPGARTHVHLAATTDSHVGKRANVAVLLGVSPARLRDAERGIFVSPNGVILVRDVPKECIAAVRAAARKGEAALAELRDAFGC